MVFTEKFSKPRSKSKKLHKYEKGGLVDDGSTPLPKDDPRSEYRKARRDIRDTPPVTVMEDFVGRLNEAKGQDNALRDAIRRRSFKTIKDSGYED